MISLIFLACSTAVDNTSDDSAARPNEATLADMLSSFTEDCVAVAGSGKLSTDDGSRRSISVCQLQGAVAWTADMDVDCDGLTSDTCNAQTDDAYQADTSIRASDGSKVDASLVPFIVVPLATGMDGCETSEGFDYRAAGVSLGAVAAVIYQDQIHYGAFVDEGPCTIIGEASYAMASRFGFDPDPNTGGHEPSDVTYVVLTGADAVAEKVEDEAGVESLAYNLIGARFGIPD